MKKIKLVDFIDTRMRRSSIRVIARKMGWEVSMDGEYLIKSEDSPTKPLRCEKCGEFLSKEAAVVISRKVFDSECAEKINTCSECGEVTSNEHYCDDCKDYHACSECGEFTYNRTYSGTRLCHDCGKECPWCDNIIPQHKELCHRCEENRRTVKNYGFSPNIVPEKMSGEKHPVYYGVEMEVDSDYPSDSTQLMRKIGDEFPPILWGKLDGSLEHGVEITTQPLSFRAHHELINWKRIGELVRELGLTDTSSCGLHIHMSRDGLKPITQAKIAMFWYAHKALFSDLCRRSPGRFCHGKSWKQSLGDRKKGREIKLREYQRRAVNFSNHNTIEFRQFNGTIYGEEVLAAIELVNSVRNFCKLHGSSFLVNEKAEEVFLDYIRNSNHKQLKNFCEEINLI